MVDASLLSANGILCPVYFEQARDKKPPHIPTKCTCCRPRPDDPVQRWEGPEENHSRRFPGAQAKITTFARGCEEVRCY